MIIQSVYIIAQLALATSHSALIFFEARVPYLVLVTPIKSTTRGDIP